MIESGSHTAGVDPARFDLPAETAVRIELPAAPLRRYVSDYHALDSDAEAWRDAVEWMLPAWPAIRVILAEHPIDLTIGDAHYRPLPVASLYGTTTRAARMVTNGGLTVGIGVTPLGWARLFRTAAAETRDRVVPLDAMWPSAEVAALVTALRGADPSGTDLKPILDAFLLARLSPPHPDEADVARLLRLVGDDRVTDLAPAADTIGIGQARLRRLANRHFGFPPKTLLVRARFMRSFLKMLVAEDAGDHSLIADSYVDIPHYLRDARRFLGMTPRQFLAMPTPYMRAVLRARAQVMVADRGL